VLPTHIALAIALSCAVGAQVGAQEQAGTARSQAERQVIAAERAVWEALKKGDWPPFDRITAGQLGFGPDGISTTKGGNLKQYDGLVTTSYSLDSIQTRLLTPDVVIVAYKATYDQTQNGQKAPSPVYMMSVWQRKGGKWVTVAHSEAIPTKASGGN